MEPNTSKHLFLKMHAMGNDFVIFPDAPVFSPEMLSFIAHRRHGIGCDQVLILRPPSSGSQADVYLEIWNADGTLAEACGNGTRCVVWWLAQQNPSKKHVWIETLQGVLEGTLLGSFEVEVQQGKPTWLLDSGTLDLQTWGLPPGIPLTLGNPHLVIFVPNLEAIDVAVLGKELEHHPFFPNRTNVIFAACLSETQVAAKVWERGVGITPACGSGACATVCAGVRQKILISPHLEIFLEGGKLDMTYTFGEYVYQKGLVNFVYKGVW